MTNLLQLQIEKYETSIKELIGKSIMSVNYYEIDYGKPYWDNVDYHSLDYGLELEMDDKEIYNFIWHKEFFQHDLKFAKSRIKQEFAKNSNIKKHLITNQKWKELFGKKIISIKSIWSYCSDDKNKTYYPETIKLQFEHDTTIWISAIEITDNGTHYMADHITVFFDEMTMRKYNILTEIQL